MTHGHASFPRAERQCSMNADSLRCFFIEIYSNVHFKLGITHPCIPFKIKHRKDVSKEVSIWATLHKSPLISLFSVFKTEKKKLLDCQHAGVFVGYLWCKISITK